MSCDIFRTCNITKDSSGAYSGCPYRVWESVTCQDITVLCHMMESHNECRRVVYRPCSSCISSV